MSDFDKEAERERLREKYEREEEKREVTERMSELLLKGATMTNAHCQDCGDPIFRYDGQEFCATCQRAVDRDSGDDGGETATDANGDREEIEVAAPEETRVQFGAGDRAADDGDPSDATADAAADDTSTGPGDERPEQRSEARTEQPTPQQPPTRPPETAVDVEGDLAAAGDSLVRSVTQLAERAEATDDVGRTRDLLAATREAAEALSAVRDAGR